MKRLLCVLLTLAAGAAAAAPPSVLTPRSEPLSAAEEPATVLLGPVSAVLDASSFRVTGRTTVVVEEATAWDGAASVAELAVGDLVRVEGRRASSDAVIAASVTVILAAAPPAVLEGPVALLTPPGGFVLASGAAVRVGPATTWSGLGGYDDLSAGDQVRVTGSPDPVSGAFAASEVLLVREASATPAVVEDAVDAVFPPDLFRLAGGLEVAVHGGTLLEGLSSIEELAVGDGVRVEGRSSPGSARLEASTVVRIAAPSGEIRLLARVAAVDLGGFTTTDGWRVVVRDATELVGIETLAELEAGVTVEVLGTAGGQPRVVDARFVTVRDGEDEGGGSAPSGEGLEVRTVGPVVAVMPPDALTVAPETRLTVDAATTWSGGAATVADLVPGDVVEATARYLRDGTLLAARIELLATSDEGIARLSGMVVNLARPGRVLLDGGEWVVFDELTQLDGDVDDVGSIAIGQLVTADCVPLGEGEWRALWARVESDTADGALPGSGPWAVLSDVDEALVVVADGADASEVAARHGAALVGTLPGILVHLLRWPQPLDEQALGELLADPEVAEIEPNLPYADPETIRRRMPIVNRLPTSADFVEQRAVAAAGFDAARARSLGEGTLVAVVDTGVDPLHPLLRHRLATGGRDFVDGDEQPWETRDGVDSDGDGEIDEAAGHGTFVAGAVLLAAPAARILPLRALDDDGHGTAFALCQAVLTAIDRGADVLNMSFAGELRSRVLDRLLDEAVRRGVVLVAGAGNDGATTLPFPARDHRVIAVAASDVSDRLAEFSNRGSGVALTAPGEEVYSALDRGDHGWWSGTSMAAPLVSGTAALLRAVHPGLGAAEIEAALRQGAAPPLEEGTPPRLSAEGALALVPDAP